MRTHLTSLLCMLTLSSCVTYEVSVNSVASPNYSPDLQPGASIHVYDANEGEDLFRAEVARKIIRLMRERGYVSAAADQADFVLMFGYAISSHSETQTVYVADSSKPTTPPPAGASFAEAFAHGMAEGLGNTTPQQQQTNVNDRSLRLAVIDARHLRATGETKTVWQCDTTSSGRSDDLRDVLNYMLVPTFRHFGEDTGKAVTYDLREHDTAVTALRRMP